MVALVDDSETRVTGSGLAERAVQDIEGKFSNTTPFGQSVDVPHISLLPTIEPIAMPRVPPAAAPTIPKSNAPKAAKISIGKRISIGLGPEVRLGLEESICILIRHFGK
jgi:hypothetical protein